MDAFIRTAAIIPRGRTTKRNCAQLRTTRAGARRRMVCCRYRISQTVSILSGFWADRTPSMPAPYAVFVKVRPRLIYRGHRHKSVHRPASARVRRQNGEHGVDDCNIATIILRTGYCTIAKLISSGRSYFVIIDRLNRFLKRRGFSSVGSPSQKAILPCSALLYRSQWL
jgi:hypothetical protein